MFNNKISLLQGLLFLLLAMCLSISTEAQTFKAGYYEAFTLDTLTDSGTITFTPARMASTTDRYNYTWQLNITEISDTTAAQVYVEESLYESGSSWAPVDTITISAAGGIITTGNLSGVRQRLRIVGTETQSFSALIGVIFRRL